MHEYLKLWLEREAMPCDHYELLGKPRFFHDRDALLQAGREGFASLQGYHNADSVRRVRVRDLQRQCAAAVQIFESDAAWQKYDEQLRLRPPEASRFPTQTVASSVTVDAGQLPASPIVSPDDGSTIAAQPPDLAATVAIAVRVKPGPVGVKSSQSGAYRIVPPSPPPPPRDRPPKSSSSRPGAPDHLPAAPRPAGKAAGPIVRQSDRYTAMNGLDSRGVRLMLIVAAATATILLAIAGVVWILLNVFSQSKAPKTAWNLVQPVKPSHRPFQPVVNGKHSQES